jgi:hypothetical protein
MIVTKNFIIQKLNNGAIQKEAWTGFRKYLNPRTVVGWKDCLLKEFDNAPVYTVESFRNQFDIELENLGKAEAISEISSMLKIEMIGTTPTAAYSYATKHARTILNGYDSNGYDNLTAVIWDRLNPDWLSFAVVELDNGQKLYLASV